MDKLFELASQIIATLETNSGYKEYHPQLDHERQIFMPELKKNYNNPNAFLEILTKINQRWGEKLSEKIINMMRVFHNKTIEHNQKVAETQSELIKMALELPENKFEESKKVDDLADSLVEMMSNDPLVLLNKQMKKSAIGSISKPHTQFKRPSKKKSASGLGKLSLN